jgi:DNA invertase Pin-like site-specific DNA recombinase
LEAAADDAWIKVESGHAQPRRYVAYYRVSTQRQGRSGLGLEAQRASVLSFLKTTGGTLTAEFTEVESGRKNDRSQLKEAVRLCRVYTTTLVIAKLDRLARNVALTAQLMESGVEFVAADFPQANRLTIHILAAIAEYEAKLISERTKAAIAAARARGVIWKGGSKGATAHLDAARDFANACKRKRAIARAVDLLPLANELRESGKSLVQIAAEFTRLAIRMPHGGTKWNPCAIRRIFFWSSGVAPNQKKWNRYAQRFE